MHTWEVLPEPTHESRIKRIRDWFQLKTRLMGMGSLAMLFAMGGCALLPAGKYSSPNPAPWYHLWSSYQARFVDAQGRVIDWDDGGVTTSEGQSYALFFALVANNPALFQKILSWTQDNLAQGSLAAHLPAWRWGERPNKTWGVLDENSAADADLWIAYTLIQAGRLWDRNSYTAMGTLLAKRINQKEVVDLKGLGPMLIPGNRGFHIAPQTYVFNPSYLPLPVLEGLAHALPHGPWHAMAEHLPAFIRATSPHGFTPDWVAYSPTKGYYEAPQGPSSSYNAIRVYLWAGMSNPKSAGTQRILQSISGMSPYLKSHLLPPVDENWLTGKPSGTGPVGFSAALIPYLTQKEMGKAVHNQWLRLNADYDQANGLYGKMPHYYDQNLALFALGWVYHTIRFNPKGELQPSWSTGKP
ncbi:cellulose synthase complex periplasmic endoglucanase BcsZ [Acidithiobacillus sp. HP-11]|uniref:cellulose synthase complex periplasmic endoglucanase BcsZ n=1 Tax=Acidithiobacillus sp. HP-11 TaxID=2697656 RepID=UPI0018798DA3|nr:cellulose synthase complex periplasmic endoglucanase BcsZ [Acidithiobacillus sp. HP-11]MBE7566661.1 cellulase [Acidithiobacillus sp. HP-11]